MHLESGDLPDSIKSWTPSSKSVTSKVYFIDRNIILHELFKKGKQC